MNIRIGKKMIAAALTAAMVITGGFSAGSLTARADSCGGLEKDDILPIRDADVIKDPILHWAIRSSLNSIKDHDLVLTAEQVGSRDVKNISYSLCAHEDSFEGWEEQYWIDNLAGLQYASSASFIEICYTNLVKGGTKRISDLSPLSGLSQLQTLILRQDGITDISSLSGLVNLEKLDLFGNKISDVSAISGMKKLKTVVLSNNQISNVDVLSDMESLEYVDIAGTGTSNLPDLSRLKNVRYLDVSGNHLSNEDVVKIGAMRGLQELNLGSSDSAITDVKPLARLIYLEKDKTTLPISNEEKENLFAAIEVNKLFNKFNISKMTSADLENVDKALAAYDALTEAQKAYFDSKRIEAARNNRELVAVGEEPDYYPEYDEDGERQPLLDRIQILVTDKRGNPLPNVTFVRKGMGSKEYNTDKNGILEIKHEGRDTGWSMSVAVKSSDYVSIPEKIEYEAEDNKTLIINGRLATGFEDLQFVLIPKGEYVDKTELDKAIKNAQEIEEGYKYTAASYESYLTALEKAKTVYDNVDADKKTVDSAAADLNAAVKGLKKTNVLRAVKLTVKDENGNIFAREFKFQVYVTGHPGQEGWNKYSDPYTGVVYLETSSRWADGKQWTIAPCYEEPYSFDPINVVIGVDGSGQRYYKTIDGKPAALDYEKTIIVKPRPGGVDAEYKDQEKKPLNTVLNEYIEKAKQYAEADYTADSFANLQKAIENAEGVSQKSGATQEEYNAAAASVKQAENGLIKGADKIALRRQIRQEYGEKYYTASAWKQYQEQLSAAQAVYDDRNALQSQVDEALSKLKAAANILLQGLKANKDELKELIDAAEGLREEDYESGYDVFKAALDELRKVYDDPEATQAMADEAVKNLEEAESALVKKPYKRDYECYPTIFKALVTDMDGTPLKGVYFVMKEEGSARAEIIRTGGDGIFEYNIPNDQRGKAVISLADLGYTTSDEHNYTVNPGVFTTIKEIDGEAFKEGIRPTYTLTANGKTPGRDPEKIPDSSIDPDNPVSEGRYGLKEQIDLAESMKYQASKYTEESFKAFTDVLDEAKKVYADADASQQTINEWIAKLKKARESLQEKEKILTDKSNIRIVVKDENGSRIRESIDFNMTLGANRPVLMQSRNGILEYELTTADSGNEKVVIAASEEAVTINGVEYLITPESHEFVLDTRSYEVCVIAVDGQYLGDGEKEVSFVLKRKNPLPVITKWSANCFTYKGSAVTGFNENGKLYLKKNKNVILPNKTSAGKAVTEIAAGAFESFGIKSVTLPSGLQKIGSRAFAKNQISRVKVPNQIKSIAKNAFAGNKTKVTLEINSKSVLQIVKKAKLDGVTVKDNTKPSTVKVRRITVTGATHKILAGKKITLQAKVSPTNATVKGVTWKSSNTKVATVNNKGVVTVKRKTGGKSVTITAKAKDGSGVAGKYKITSMKAGVKKIQITGAKSVKAGRVLKLTAKVTAPKGADKKVIWTSSNSKYAKVSSSGKVTTYKAGKGKSVRITAKAADGSGKTKTVIIKLK